MKQALKMYVLTLISAMFTAIPVLAPATVHAQGANIQGSVECGTELTFTDAGGTCAAPRVEATETANRIIRLVINIFSVIVGVVAVIMIIVGGLKYITSGGDASSVSSAKNTILYAVIGLVVVALAQFIVRFVLQRVTAT